jgi:hypothetical protein
MAIHRLAGDWCKAKDKKVLFMCKLAYNKGKIKYRSLNEIVAQSKICPF